MTDQYFRNVTGIDPNFYRLYIIDHCELEERPNEKMREEICSSVGKLLSCSTFETDIRITKAEANHVSAILPHSDYQKKIKLDVSDKECFLRYIG